MVLRYVLNKSMRRLSDYINSVLTWFEFILWDIGWLVIQFLKGNIKEVIEITYWIRIHLAYNGRCVEKKKMPAMLIIKNKCISALGFLVLVGIIFGCSKLFRIGY